MRKDEKVRAERLTIGEGRPPGWRRVAADQRRELTGTNLNNRRGDVRVAGILGVQPVIPSGRKKPDVDVGGSPVPAKKTTDGRTPDGKWIDRWIEGGVKCKRTFDRKGGRDAFRDARRRAQQLGRDIAAELLLDEDFTLNAWVEEWWARHAVPNLERQTRDSYKQQWGKWIGPRLGSYELRALTPRLINVQLVQAMCKAGAGEPTVRRSLSVLQSILRLAVTEERIPANPVDLIDKPSSLPDGGLDPIPPATVEELRRLAIARRGPLGLQDAFIISVLGYEGLRPQELLALMDDDVLSRYRQAVHRA
jgi:Phage integrase, N-terminal SAM-like domain